jgi:hypothetical protein
MNHDDLEPMIRFHSSDPGNSLGMLHGWRRIVKRSAVRRRGLRTQRLTLFSVRGIHNEKA